MPALSRKERFLLSLQYLADIAYRLKMPTVEQQLEQQIRELRKLRQ